MRIEKMILEKRKTELKNMCYGELQRTPEYKDYLEKFVYSKSCLMNEEIEFILNSDSDDVPFNYDDIENIYYFDKERLISDILEEVEAFDIEETAEFFKGVNDNFNTKIKNIGDVEILLNKLDDEELKELIKDYLVLYFEEYNKSQEIFQWFLMSEEIINQLHKRGEPILNGKYWGRTCCGQSIELDGVIIEIFKEWYLNLYGVGQ
jgi:hypothetical protein